jgi:ankyrin repeat protein
VPFLQYDSPRTNANFKQTPEGDSAKALLDLDTHHRLFSGNTQRKLEVAVLLSHVDLVKNLLKEGVDPNYLGSRGELMSPLEQACNNRDFRLIKQLVEAGADVTPSTVLLGYQSEGQAPFEWALQQADRGDTHVLRYFLENGARPVPGRQPHTKSLESCRILRHAGIETYFEPIWHDAMDAVIDGNEDDVAEYIAAGVDINKNLSKMIFGDLPRGDFEHPTWRDISCNCTLLQAAVETRHLGIVRILVKNNVDVNAAIYSPRGWSALEIAHSMGQTAIISELLQRGALFNVTPPAERTLVEVYYAFDNKDIEIIRRLLYEHRVDHMDLLDLTWEHTLNTIRSAEGHHKIRREVLQLIRNLSGGDMNGMGPRTQRCVLELAVRLGDLEYAMHLFSLGARVKADPQRCSQTFLKSVVGQAERGSDCSKLVGMVLKFGALEHEPDGGHDVFKIAVKAGFYGFNNFGMNLEPARLILEAGLDVNARPLCPPKRIVIGFRRCRSAELFEDHSPLQILIYRYATWPCRELERSEVNAVAPMVEFMVAHGADINAHPSDGRESGTPLQLAVSIFHRNSEIGLDMLRLLIRLGADVNSAAGDFGRTALQHASHYPALVEFLLENGANVNAPAGKVSGRTALQLAAEYGHINIVKRFLELGADPNAQAAEFDGLTALEAAGKSGHLDTAILLLDNGAIPTERAAQAAQDHYFFVIARIIRERIEGVSNQYQVEDGLMRLEG